MRMIRQALAMMREEKLFSGIYILGTALAIAFTMVIAVVYYAKLADIAPEVNRSRTVYVKGMARRSVLDTLRWEPTNYSSEEVKEWLYTLKSAEMVSVTYNMNRYTNDRHYLKCDNHKLVPVVARRVDQGLPVPLRLWPSVHAGGLRRLRCKGRRIGHHHPRHCREDLWQRC